MMKQGAVGLYILLIFWLIASNLSASDESGYYTKKLLPPSNGIYFGAYPDFSGYPNETGFENAVTREKVSDFEEIAGKPIIWAFFSKTFGDGFTFPSVEVKEIQAEGVLPYIRLIPRSNVDACPEKKFTLSAIISGQFDKDLSAFARSAREVKAPLMIEFACEANGDWFPWNAKWNGGNNKDGYGEPDQYDGPERYRDAFRHIVKLFRAEKADNVTWFFHINNADSPDVAWNRFADYYPGDEYVDWVGVSVYGPLKPGDEWESFTSLMDKAYPKLCKLTKIKPLALLEFGAYDDGSDKKARWIAEALNSIIDKKYPRIQAVSYWHEIWQNDDQSVSNLRLDSSPKVMDTFRKLIKNDCFVSKPEF
ncbi:MAG: glycosyl hydrolase [Candidatus Wallbacteria bacterium]|nr:glycosyl hydrolase [Candidatus Wallbacteria bacterium]